MSRLVEGLSKGNIDKEDVKLKLRFLFSQHLSLPVRMTITQYPYSLSPHYIHLYICLSLFGQFWKEITRTLDTTLKIEDRFILTSSLLLYLVDGLVPLVTAFCIQLSAHNSSGLISKVYSSLLTPKILAVLKSFGDAIAVSVTYEV